MNDNAICIGGDVIESQKKREPWKDKAIEPKGPAAISKIGSSIEIETIKDLNLWPQVKIRWWESRSKK